MHPTETEKSPNFRFAGTHQIFQCVASETYNSEI